MRRGLHTNAHELVEYLNSLPADEDLSGGGWDELEQVLAAVMQPIRDEIEDEVVRLAVRDGADRERVLALLDDDWAAEITVITDPVEYAAEILNELR
jgi:hypothetical protein